MICERCGNEHDGSYGSGRFCSLKCANTRKHSDETKRKIGKGLAKSKPIDKIKEIQFSDLSTRTIRKIFTRMKLGCSLCNWDKVACDLHHIIPKSKGGSDNTENLTYICPNCHRLVHAKKIKNESLINLEKYIGNEWKQFYFR